jgi:acyl-CoA synthetase (AMP-forming)/AMP-acid ligase II
MSGVFDFLLEGRDPLSTALSFERGDCSYRSLSTATNRASAYLLSLGCVKGDRILLIGDNSLFWVASYLGTLRAGLVSVPLSPTTSPADLSHIVNATGARVAFLGSRAAAGHAEVLAGLHVVTEQTLGGEVLEPESPADGSAEMVTPVPAIDADDLAALMFTSGSTGTPRGVMVSHGNIIANTTSIIESLNLTARDRVMTVLPFHYCFGTSLLHTHLRVGGSLVVDSRFMYVERILDRLATSACTGFAGVPSHFQILLRSSGLRQDRFPHLRYVQQAGGHLPPAQIDGLRSALPNTQIFVMYGQTEATARLSCLPPDQLGRKRGSIGKGIPGVRLRVVNDADEEVQPGEVGEITAEGGNIARGYWGQPEESAATFRNGRLYTGDLATVDEDGFIYIAGRKKEFLKIRGERVSCQAIESHLLELDELAEAAVVGIPDDVLGEAVRAFVVSRSGEPAGLVTRVHAFCKQRMPAHLVPREILVLPSLPKNGAGKVIKAQLREIQSLDGSVGKTG